MATNEQPPASGKSYPPNWSRMTAKQRREWEAAQPKTIKDAGPVQPARAPEARAEQLGAVQPEARGGQHDSSDRQFGQDDDQGDEIIHPDDALQLLADSIAHHAIGVDLRALGARMLRMLADAVAASER